jgi:hypothetical protein
MSNDLFNGHIGYLAGTKCGAYVWTLVKLNESTMATGKLPNNHMNR